MRPKPATSDLYEASNSKPDDLINRRYRLMRVDGMVDWAEIKKALRRY